MMMLAKEGRSGRGRSPEAGCQGRGADDRAGEGSGRKGGEGPR